jgi:citrate synthase
MEHPAGFDPHGASCPAPVRETLALLGSLSPGVHLAWLDQQRVFLEEIADCPLAMTGVAAAALVDLGLTPIQGEMLFLLLRLPGAAVHALEQQENGWRRFPFFREAVHLADDPGPVDLARTETVDNR